MSLLKQIQSRNTASASFESAAVAEGVANDLEGLGQQVEAHLAEIRESEQGASAAVQEVDQTVRTSSAIDQLVDATIATHGEEGMDEGSAALLQTSVECLLRAAGLPIPASILVPSFESCTSPAHYSAEVGEKKKGVIGRLWAWLKDAFARMVKFAKTIYARIMLSSEKIEDRLGELAKAVQAMNMSSDHIDKKISCRSEFQRNRAGEFAKPEQAMKDAVGVYQSYSMSVATSFEQLNTIFTRQYGTYDQMIAAVFEGVKKAHAVFEKDKEEYLPGHFAVITPGTDGSNRFIGATFKLDVKEGMKNEQGPVLDPHEARSGYEACVSAMKSYKESGNLINKWLKGLELVENKVNQTEIKAGVSAEEESNLRKQLGGILTATSIGSQIWMKTAPVLLEAINSNIDYVSKSAAMHR